MTASKSTQSRMYVGEESAMLSTERNQNHKFFSLFHKVLIEYLLKKTIMLWIVPVFRKDDGYEPIRSWKH